MNQLVNMNNTTATMTVYEIAKLVNYKPKHKEALKVCETLMLDPDFTGGESPPALESVTYNDRGQTLKSYALNKRQSFALASRLNVAFLMRVIDRWQELEAIVTPTQPTEPTTVTYLEQVEANAMIPAFKERAKLLILEDRKKHAKAMEKLTLESEIIHNKLTELKMVKVNGDVNASRAQLPRESITKLLLSAGSTITPVEANAALINLGFLHKNRKTITQEGLYYGHSWTGGKSHNPKWYSIDFKTDLLVKITEELYK